jgi:hypothetical protein
MGCVWDRERRCAWAEREREDGEREAAERAEEEGRKLTET